MNSLYSKKKFLDFVRLLHFVLKRKEITDSEKEQQMTAIQKTNDQTKYAETTHM